MKSDPTCPKLSHGHAARRALVLFVMTLMFAAVAVAQEEAGAVLQDEGKRADARAKKEPRASVRGRVTYRDTGKPLRRAVVLLLKDINHPPTKRTMTDRRGEFRFRGVAAGEYLVTAEAPGIVSRSSGFSIQDTGFGLAGVERSISRVKVGEEGETKVEFGVERGGAFGGRVTYSDGEPVAGAHLVLYVRGGGTLTRFFTDHARTDDRGAYRVEGLPAGDYVVGVVERGAGSPKLLPRVEGTGIAARYHPAASSAREAAAVRVEPGGEAEGVDIRLAENELRRLAGTVRWRRSGEPAGKSIVMLRRRDDPSVEVSLTDFLLSITPRDVDNDQTTMRDLSLFTMMSSNAPYVESDDEGRWSFEDIAPGVYVLTAAAPPLPDKEERPEEGKEEDAENDPKRYKTRPYVLRRVTVTLGSSDVTDQRIEMIEGGRVSGRVTIEGGGPPPFGVRLYISTQGAGAESLFTLPEWIERDGTFMIEALSPGEVFLHVTLPHGSRHYVRSITAGGVDLTREPLRVAEAAEIAGVHIDLGSDPAQVSGRVLDADDRAPIPSAGVLLVAADESQWRSRSSRVFARADAAGEFNVEAAPGDYLLLAWRPGDEPTGSFEANIRARAATARKVTLKPGANPSVELLTPRPAAPEKR